MSLTPNNYDKPAGRAEANTHCKAAGGRPLGAGMSPDGAQIFTWNTGVS